MKRCVNKEAQFNSIWEFKNTEDHFFIIYKDDIPMTSEKTLERQQNMLIKDRCLVPTSSMPLRHFYNRPHFPSIIFTDDVTARIIAHFSQGYCWPFRPIIIQHKH